VNYEGSRISQMLAELFLQFSELCFSSSKRGSQTSKIIGNNSFPEVLEATGHSSQSSRAVMCYKKLI
jgi:hypothetical protein